MSKAVYIVLPAYQPTNILFELIDSLLKNADEDQINNTTIIVVNDGSTAAESVEVFAKITTAFKNVIILSHQSNYGKGNALKTGFSFIRDNFKGTSWVVTADADGQHLANDIWSVVKAGVSERTLVIGARRFDKNVPLRSRLGNTVTHLLFNFIHKNEVSDTQTGLRGFDSEEIPSLLALKSNGYAFELEALIYFTSVSQIREIPIATVYEPGNPTSHFRPFLDSAAIYAVLFRHIAVGLFAMLLEIFLFLLFSYLGFSNAVALPTARLISCSALFLLARNFVFNSHKNIAIQAFYYVCLVIVNLIIAVKIINFSENVIGINKLTGLFLSYLIMFIFNFLIQKYVIFSRS